MSWTRALTYVAAWLILSAIYLATQRGKPPAEVEVAAPAEPPPYANLRVEEVVGLDLEAGEGRVRAARKGGRWFVVEPAGRPLSPDLIAALVGAVLEAAGVEVVSRGTDRDAEFGLDRPWGRLTFHRHDGTKTNLFLGAKNPAETGIYARGDAAPETVLLGLDVEYYVGLVVKAAGGGGS
jgi:hypothetical protein